MALELLLARSGVERFAAHLCGVQHFVFAERQTHQHHEVDRAGCAVGQFVQFADHLLATVRAAAFAAHVGLAGGQLVGDHDALGGVGPGVGHAERVGHFATHFDIGGQCGLGDLQVGGGSDLDFRFGVVVERFFAVVDRWDERGLQEGEVGGWVRLDFDRRFVVLRFGGVRGAFGQHDVAGGLRCVRDHGDGHR